MAVNHLEATLWVCYCPTRTLAHELLVIWPVVCLAWLPCTEDQSCGHFNHEGNSVRTLEVIHSSQSSGSYFMCLLLPYKDLRAQTFGNLTYCVPGLPYCVPSLATMHTTSVLGTFVS